jgi:hemerythrin-like domain-containing protein
MLIQIGATPDSDFSEPLGVLSDCHKRIEYFLHDLIRLAEDVKQLDPAQCVALEKALRYFRESGPRHTADEEESLFPRLRAMNDGRLNQAFEKIEKLEADHKRANKAHSTVDAIGVRWLADGVIGGEEAVCLKTQLQELSGLYEHHLAVEDAEIFPFAATLLSADDKTELGQEMARRRGLSADIVKTALHSGSTIPRVQLSR